MASKIGAAFSKLLRGIRSTGSTGTPAAPPDRPRPARPARPATPARSAPSSDSTLAGASIEYNPDLDGDADPGEVVWTWVPWEEDPTQGKDRPVVIVGRRKGMLIGVPLTSKDRDDGDHVPVGVGSWDRDGRPSYAKVDRVLEVDPDQVRREGSILDRAAFDRVIAALRRPRR